MMATQNKKKNKKIAESSDIVSYVIIFLLILQCVILVIPFVWAFFTSLKTNLELRSNLLGLPKNWEWPNYQDALRNITTTYTDKANNTSRDFTLQEMVFNSIAFSAVSAFTVTITTYIVAYIRNFYNFKVLKVLDVIVLFVTTVPIVGSLPSSLQLFTSLGLINNFFGMTVIAKVTFTSSYYFIIGAVIRSVSTTYIEAGEIDGANELQLFTRIMLPLTFSIFFTVYVFNFISYWNDYQTAYIYLKNFPTASYGLWAYKNTGGNARLPRMLAASFVVLVPMLIIFALFRKRLMTGLSFEGGEKG